MVKLAVFNNVDHRRFINIKATPARALMVNHYFRRLIENSALVLQFCDEKCIMVESLCSQETMEAEEIQKLQDYLDNDDVYFGFVKQIAERRV